VRYSLERLQIGQPLSEVLTASKVEFDLAAGEVERLETLLEELIPSSQPMLELKRE
jgi:hypothetical protein